MASFAIFVFHVLLILGAGLIMQQYIVHVVLHHSNDIITTLMAIRTVEHTNILLTTITWKSVE